MSFTLLDLAMLAGNEQNIDHRNQNSSYTFEFLFIYLFIYFWLHWVFVAAHGLSLVVASGGYSSLQYTGFSSWWLLLLWSMSSVVVACRL